MRGVVITLDVETYDRLQSIADEAGKSCADCAASILRDVAADDAATHGEMN